MTIRESGLHSLRYQFSLTSVFSLLRVAFGEVGIEVGMMDALIVMLG